MDKSLNSLIEFVKFTVEFSKVERDLFLPKEDRLENDSEHSFQLAIVAWYIIEKNKTNLDLNLVIKYCGA